MPRILTSSKYQAAGITTILAAVALAFGLLRSPGLDAAERMVTTFIVAVAAAWGVAGTGAAIEDYAKHRDGPAVRPTPRGTGKDVDQ